MENDDSNSTPPRPQSGYQFSFPPNPSDNPFGISTPPTGYSPSPFFSPPQLSYTGLLQTGFPYQHFPFTQQPPIPNQPHFFPNQTAPTPAQEPPIPTQLSFDEDDEEEVVPETQPQQQSKKKSGKFAKRAKPIPWSADEEVALMKSWIDISEDNTVGTNQRRAAFWTRVTNQFHVLMNKGEYRTVDQVTSKFKDLNAKVMKFSAIHNYCEINRRSGASENDILEEALTRYRDENNGIFGHIAAWKVARLRPKWGQATPMDLPPRPSKRSKTSGSNNEHALSSDAHGGGFNLNDEEEGINNDDEHEDDDDEPVRIQQPRRPTGRDKGKQAASGSKSAASSDSISTILSSLNDFKDRGEKYISYRVKRLEVKEKELAIREQERKDREEERKERAFQFLIKPHDDLSGDALKICLARKQEIRDKYGWNF